MDPAAPPTSSPLLRWAEVAIRGGRVIRNAALDLRYGGVLAATRLQDRHYSNTDYGLLGSVEFTSLTEDDVLVDIGCGAGRVINYWLSLGLRNRMIGIELDEALARRCRRRLRRYDNVDIRWGDATETLPEEGTVFYLYNPMGRTQTERLEAGLRAAAAGGRLRRVIYHNPKFAHFFEADGAWEIDYDASPGGRSVAPFHPVAYIRPTARRPETEAQPESQ